jgi:predicted secreted hydrolase
MKTRAALAMLFLAAPLWAFDLPQPGHVFSFPRDFGAHPSFRIEWWYLTGHLFSGERRFGFQATFFRVAEPASALATDNPSFSSRQFFLAHMALTDVATGRFYHAERLNRAGWDAHASDATLDLSNGEWTLKLDRAGPRPTFRLHGAVEAKLSFDLQLMSEKPLVVFGEDGVSRKGADSAASSYYLTFSRLRTTGTVVLAGEPDQRFAVQGEAWMDHEISSSQLSAGQVGWDWTCVQFGHAPGVKPWELMLYRMRRADGTADPHSILQWVDPDGNAKTEPFRWEVLSTWKSPRSHATYPSRVRLTTRDPATGREVSLVLSPLVRDQELANALGGGPYWEGACDVQSPEGRSIGVAYLELTGYAKALKI